MARVEELEAALLGALVAIAKVRYDFTLALWSLSNDRAKPPPELHLEALDEGFAFAGQHLPPGASMREHLAAAHQAARGAMTVPPKGQQC